MSNEARKDEADGKQVEFEWRGHSFTVSREYADWSIDLVESLEEGKAVGIVRGALGPQQWQRVKSMNLKVRDLDELSQTIASAMGLGSAGESPASSD